MTNILAQAGPGFTPLLDAVNQFNSDVEAVMPWLTGIIIGMIALRFGGRWLLRLLKSMIG